MAEGDELDQILKSLLQEYQDAGLAARASLGLGGAQLATAATVLTTVTAIAFHDKVYAVLLVIPYGVSVFLLYSIRNLLEIFRHGGYRRAIEDILAEALGTRVLVWEDAVANLFSNDMAVRGPQATYAAGYVASLGVSVGAAFAAHLQPLAALGIFLSYGLISATLVIALIQVLRTRDATYRVATQALDLTRRKVKALAAAKEALSVPAPTEEPRS